jgi:hypothetical protein
MLLSMFFPTIIAAIFHEVTAITFLQFDVIHFADATVSTTYICLFSLAHFLINLLRIEDIGVERPFGILLLLMLPTSVG